MFYGGGLLANLKAEYLDDDKDGLDLINLLTINPNVIIVTDSDRKTKRAHFKPRVKRIQKEFQKLDQEHAFHWLLKAREIENYLTGELVNHALTTKMANPVSPTLFESFYRKQGEDSYLQEKANRETMDKTELARITTPHMTKEVLIGRFDLNQSMEKVVALIRSWNS